MAKGTKYHRQIATKEIKCERKSFVLDLAENQNGGFLKIAEQTQRGRDAVIIPTSGLKDFEQAVQTLCQIAHLQKTLTPPRFYRTE